MVPDVRGRVGEATPGRDLAYWTAVLTVAAVAVVVRFLVLDTVPGEWYGDISTVYEYVLALRAGQHPPGYFLLGVGPLYPMVVRPVLWALGDSYLSIKTAAALISLLGLALLFALARELFDRGVALVALATAAVGSWWLVFSRLGDQQPLNPTLTLAAVLCAVRAVRSQRSIAWPVAAGALSSCGLYLYGNTFVLPVVTAMIVGAGLRREHLRSRTAALFTASGIAVAMPIVVESIRHLDTVRDGHNGQRLVTGWAFFPNLVEGYAQALAAYVTTGDEVFRSNPVRSPHVDQVSFVAGCVGAVVLLSRPLRRRGLLVIGAFLLLHLPSVLAGTADVPSAGRTLAAAPFAYLMVAVGACWMGGQLAARTSDVVAACAVAALVVVIGVVNVRHYATDYVEGLPYGNTAIARSITDYVARLDARVGVHLVGPGWGPNGMPEPKSIRYVIEHPERFAEHDGASFGCEDLRSLARPSVLVWSFDEPLPSEPVEACAGLLGDVHLHTADDGRPVFHSAVLVPSG
jgi:hypothetical protein